MDKTSRFVGYLDRVTSDQLCEIEQQVGELLKKRGKQLLTKEGRVHYNDDTSPKERSSS